MKKKKLSNKKNIFKLNIILIIVLLVNLGLVIFNFKYISSLFSKKVIEGNEDTENEEDDATAAEEDDELLTESQFWDYYKSFEKENKLVDLINYIDGYFQEIANIDFVLDSKTINIIDKKEKSKAIFDEIVVVSDELEGNNEIDDSIEFRNDLYTYLTDKWLNLK